MYSSIHLEPYLVLRYLDTRWRYRLKLCCSRASIFLHRIIMSFFCKSEIIFILILNKVTVANWFLFSFCQTECVFCSLNPCEKPPIWQNSSEKVRRKFDGREKKLEGNLKGVFSGYFGILKCLRPQYCLKRVKTPSSSGSQTVKCDIPLKVCSEWKNWRILINW